MSRVVVWFSCGAASACSYLDELPLGDTGEPITEEISCGPLLTAFALAAYSAGRALGAW